MGLPLAGLLSFSIGFRVCRHPVRGHLARVYVEKNKFSCPPSHPYPMLSHLEFFFPTGECFK